MVGIPSGSVAVALQVTVSSLKALVALRVILVMVGSIFSTLTESEEVTVSPSESVAIAVQVIVFPTSDEVTI